MNNPARYFERIVPRDQLHAHDLGSSIGEMLLHAAEKQAIVKNIEARAQKFAPTIGKRRPVGLIGQYESLAREHEIQSDKLDMRKGIAQDLLNAQIELQLIDIEKPEFTYHGTLTDFDLVKRTLRLSTDDETSTVGYAKVLPVPEDLDQTYVGMSLTKDFVVVSYDANNAWALGNA